MSFETEGLQTRSGVAEAVTDAVDSIANNLNVINSYDLADKAKDAIRVGSAAARVKDQLGISQGHRVSITKEEVVQGLSDYLRRTENYGDINPTKREENVRLVYEPLLKNTTQGKHDTPEQVESDLQAILNGGVVRGSEVSKTEVHEQINARDSFRKALNIWKQASEDTASENK